MYHDLFVKNAWEVEYEFVVCIFKKDQRVEAHSETEIVCVS